MPVSDLQYWVFDALLGLFHLKRQNYGWSFSDTDLNRAIFCEKSRRAPYYRMEIEDFLHVTEAETKICLASLFPAYLNPAHHVNRV